MKQINEYIIESFNKKALWRYVDLVKAFLRKYNETIEKNKAKVEKYDQGKSPRFPKLTENTSFKAYPMAIIVDKFGYSKKLTWKRSQGREVPDWSDYADFIVKKCKEENKTYEDLAQWWYDYDTELIRKNWQDPKWLFKQIDFERFWNPYYPNDDSCLQSIIETPQKLLSYVSTEQTSYWSLTQEERAEVDNYYTDPTNAEALSKAIKAAKKKIEAQRPTYQKSLQLWLKKLMSYAKFEGGQFGSRYDLEDELENEKKEREKGWNRGANDTRNELASAMSSIILKSLDEKFDYKNDPKTIVDEGDYLSIFVKELGPSKKSSDTSGVYSSSFWTYYRYDFEVTIFKKNDKEEKEEIFKKKFENITVASTYYSGGW